MDSKKIHTALTRQPSPATQPGAASSSSSSSVKVDVATASKSDAKDFNSLHDLQEKKHLLSQIREASVREVKGEVSTTLTIGQYTSEGQRYWVVPEGFIVEDDPLGVLIDDFSRVCGATVKMLNVPCTRTHVYSKKFILGLWSGLGSATIQRRNMSKKEFELGRSCIFSLIVKSAFEKRKKLGSDALAKDQSFFGNNPGEIKDRYQSSFIVKARIQSYFVEKDVCKLLYNILLETASAIDLENLTEEEVNKVIKANIMPVEQLIASFYPTIPVVKGKKRVFKKKKPNPIRSSPLFTRDEMSLLARVTSFLHTDEEEILSKNYFGLVGEYGFAHIKKRIASLIQQRWELLQRFAHVTKIRLQNIRKVTKDQNIRKATVTQEQVNLYLNNLQDPACSLAEEITHILGKTSLREAFIRSYGIEPAKPDLFLLGKCVDVYTSMKVAMKVQKAVSSDSMDRKNYREIRVLVSRIGSQFGMLNHHIDHLKFIRRNKLFGHLREFKGLLKNVMGEIESLRTYKEDDVSRFAIESVHPDIKSLSTFISWTVERFESAVSELREILEVRLKTVGSDNLCQKILTHLLQILPATKSQTESF